MIELRRAHWIAIGVVLYLALGIGSMLVRSPFTVAVEEACEMGDWSADQVTFLSGSYGFRIFYSVADAQLRVQTEQGAVPVHVELRNTPLLGWTVMVFERGAPQRASRPSPVAAVGR